jgi:hypothetical protein
MPPARRPAVLLLSVAALSCSRPDASARAGQADSVPVAATELTYRSPDGTFQLELPTRWKGHFRIDTISTAERGLARPGAVAFNYLPSDSTFRPQAMLVIAVYDSAAWVAVRRESGPPPGDSVASGGGRVYVVGQPQSNPFPPGVADAIMFDLLRIRSTEVGELMRPR